MLTKKLRRGHREYGVEDETGNTLIDPSATTKGAARVAAARLAERRGESVYMFEVGEDSDGTHIVVDREEIRPPVERPKSKAQIKREIDEVLARKPGGILGGGLARNVSADRPMAAPGLSSYRLRSPYGSYIMIGARDHDDAMREAARSTPNPDRAALEIWDGSRYVKVFGAGRRSHATKKSSEANDSRVVVFGEPGSPPLYVSPWMTKAQADREVRQHRAMNTKRGHDDYEVVLEPRWMVEEREEYARRHSPER